LPTPFQSGVDFGRRSGTEVGIGSGVTTAPDGQSRWSIAAVFGAGGTTCSGPNVAVADLQFDTSGKLLKNSAPACSSARR
jgi:hypothetical protein